MCTEQQNRSSQELPVYSDSASTMPPNYNSRAGSVASHEPKKPMTTEQREAMLTKFAEEKERANDNYGGHKGAANQFEANDPTRPFRRLSQMLRGGVGKGEEKLSWRKPRSQDDGNRGYTDEGYTHEVAKGDQEGIKIV